MPQPPRKLWAVAMNATEVRIVRGLGPDAAGDAAKDETAFAIEAQQLRDIMADKPGRSHASTGDGSRSAMEYRSDPVADHTRALLRQAIAMLSNSLAKGEFRDLAVYAEHAVLGEWRKLVPPALAKAVIRETPANHAGKSARDLRDFLEKDLSTRP